MPDGQSTFSGRERRQDGSLADRVTRLEAQFEAFQAEIRRQIIRDGVLHDELERLIAKQDERMDREHDERVQLSSDIRALVAEVAAQVRNVVSRLALIGAILIVTANIVGPIIAPIIAAKVNLP